MAKIILLGLLGLIVFCSVVMVVVYQPVIRPWHARWGATDGEVQMVLMGDELVTGDAFQTTRSIDVQAPAEKVWPWLVQIGQGRGGYFSYDWLENLAGCDIHTLHTIRPELQGLKVGDIIKMGPQKGLPYYTVEMLEPGNVLVLRSVNSETGEVGGTWGFYLVEAGAGSTRLIIRHRDLPSLDPTEKTMNAIFEPISFVMEHRMLHGLREHAEKLPTLVN